MNERDQYCPDEMLALLKWYRAAGVTIGVSDEPVNRFLQPANQASAISGPLSNSPGSRNIQPDAGQSGVNSPPPASNMPPDGGAAVFGAPRAGLPPDTSEAAKLAAEAKNLDDLRQALETYDGCSLKLRARKLVFEDGNRKAKIMLIGEAPGREEDLDGRPFVGRSGMLLDRMLAFIGLDRSGVYIANTVPWRPPGNRTPSPLEVALCAPFLQRQIEMVAPKILITLGAAATRTMFDARLSITKVRGQWRKLELGQLQVRAMPTLHPAFLLRQPAQKRLVWLDMLAIARAMEEMGIEKSLRRSDSQ